MVCFVKVASVGRIIYSIFHRLNLGWRNRSPQGFLHKLLEIPGDEVPADIAGRHLSEVS